MKMKDEIGFLLALNIQQAYLILRILKSLVQVKRGYFANSVKTILHKELNYANYRSSSINTYQVFCTKNTRDR